MPYSPETDLERVLAGTGHPDSVIRLMHLYALAGRFEENGVKELEAEASLPYLKAALDSSDWKTRSFCCGVLGSMGKPTLCLLQKLEQLVQHDPELVVRAEAEKALAKISAQTG